MATNPRLEELWGLVRRIPAGRVAAYSALGRALDRPVSGFLVGRMMANCPDDVPWWRVIKLDGHTAVDKISPGAGIEQLRKLREENTPFLDEETVARAAFVDPDTFGIAP